MVFIAILHAPWLCGISFHLLPLSLPFPNAITGPLTLQFIVVFRVDLLSGSVCHSCPSSPVYRSWFAHLSLHVSALVFLPSASVRIFPPCSFKCKSFPLLSRALSQTPCTVLCALSYTPPSCLQLLPCVSITTCPDLSWELHMIFPPGWWTLHSAIIPCVSALRLKWSSCWSYTRIDLLDFPFECPFYEILLFLSLPFLAVLT